MSDALENITGYSLSASSSSDSDDSDSDGLPASTSTNVTQRRPKLRRDNPDLNRRHMPRYPTAEQQLLARLRPRPRFPSDWESIGVHHRQAGDGTGVALGRPRNDGQRPQEMTEERKNRARANRNNVVGTKRKRKTVKRRCLIIPRIETPSDSPNHGMLPEQGRAVRTPRDSIEPLDPGTDMDLGDDGAPEVTFTINDGSQMEDFEFRQDQDVQDEDVGIGAGGSGETGMA